MHGMTLNDSNIKCTHMAWMVGKCDLVCMVTAPGWCVYDLDGVCVTWMVGVTWMVFV